VAFLTGTSCATQPRSPYFRCIDADTPVLEAAINQKQADKIARAWRNEAAAKLVFGASMRRLPLIARGTMLGLFACTRQEG
jgi:hypothetical protein